MAEKDDAGAAQVQEKMDEVTDQGFRGIEVDPTPNENYSVAGVTAGKPTPETDPEHAAKIAAATHRPSRFAGPVELPAKADKK